MQNKTFVMMPMTTEKTTDTTSRANAFIWIFIIAIITITAGCVSPIDDGDIAYQLNSTFAAQFEELIARWNNVSELQVATTKEGLRIYFDRRLGAANLSCTNRMAPTFGCNDIMLEYAPEERDLKAGDVVSFEIYGNESSLFGEEGFSGTKIIQRRIYRIGDNGEPYYVMKRDATDVAYKTLVRFDRIRGKAAGFIFDAALGENEFLPYTGRNRSLQNYNDLVGQWNAFVTSVYEGSIEGRFALYYDKGFEVPSLACTGSMRPTIDCNDLILSYKPQNESELKQGNIISFRIAPNETSGFLEPPSDKTIHVMHRIFRVTTSQGRTAYITKGDNPETNAQTDAIYLDFGRVETKVLAYFKESFNETFSIT